MSIFNVFNIPLLPHPKTSAGILSLAVFLFAYITFKKVSLENSNLLDLFKKKLILHKPIDILMVLYLLACCLSLFFTSNISSLINLRFIFLGLIMFFSVQISPIASKQRHLVINGLAILTLLVSFISILQLIIPNIMNWIANAYFGSADAQGLSGEVVLGVNQDYNGLVTDFSRGRLLHWGSITLCFSAFYLSLFLYKKKKDYFFYLYLILGFSLLVISFISSNFRWTVICFLLITLATIKVVNYFKKIDKKVIASLVISLLFFSFLGLLISSVAFGYNLVDRFLLSDVERDVNDTMGRLYLYQLAIEVFSGAPIFGVGFGSYYDFVQRIQNFRYFSVHDQLTYVLTPMAPHNDWLLILAELGLFGFLVFFLIIYSAIKQFYLVLKDDGLNEVDLYMYILGLMSILGFFMYGLFENIYPHNFIYIFTFIGIAFSHDTRKILLVNAKK